MDKKKLNKPLPLDDVKGFEEFIEGQSGESTKFLPKNTTKREVSFEHFTFLTNDSERLVRLKNLVTDKLPFTVKYEQAEKILQEQRQELVQMKKILFEICDKENSPYRKSIQELFDAFFAPPKI